MAELKITKNNFEPEVLKIEQAERNNKLKIKLFFKDIFFICICP